MTYLQDIQITPFDKKRWVVNTPSGNHLLVNQSTKKLLDILMGTKDQREALKKFNHEFDQTLDKQSFEHLLQQKFENAHILQSEQAKKFRKKSYLTLKIPLLHSKLAGLLARPLVPLFNPALFWMLFGGCFVLTSTVGFTYFSFENSWINLENFLLYSIIMYSTMLLHELGHIAACRRFGVAHGEIGFGFYSIFPVLYADVTRIWRLDKHKRTIANLGGIYLEVVYAAAWSICYLYTQEMIYLIASVSILLKTLTELNPFVRFDGYWILSDLTNTPNLLPKANMVVKDLLARLRNKSQTGKWRKSTYLLASYGLANWLVLCIYLTWMISSFQQSILGFPHLIFQIVEDLSRKNTDSLIGFFSFDGLMVLGFYLLVSKWIIKACAKLYKKIKHQRTPGLNGMDQESLVSHP